MHVRSLIRQIFTLYIFVIPTLLSAQYNFSRSDSLKGNITTLRNCYDVTFYDLELKIDPKRKRIAGSNEIFFTANRNFNRMQIDLSERYHIARISYDGRQLVFDRDYDAVIIDFPKMIMKGQQASIEIIYGGAPPIEEEKQGGFSWGKDETGQDFIGINSTGIDPSSWWPLKDHPSDEPDSMRIGIIIPNRLFAVSNGRYQGFERLPGEFLRYQWTVSNTINPSSVMLSIGDYVEIKDVFKDVNGEFHHLNYYILRHHKKEGEKYFKRNKRVLRSYEGYLGAYPFWKDDFKIVEGLSTNGNQNGITYGGNFDVADQGVDFFLTDAFAHEWFGNSITAGDYGEIWIHEAFAAYMETLYAEDLEGMEQAQEVLNVQRASIQNKQKILGPLSVNFKKWEDKDVAYKGSWMLHSLRQVVANDSLWFDTLKELATIYKGRIVSTQEITDFFNQKLGQDYTYLFDQYLTHATIPAFEYKILKSGNRFEMEYRWQADEDDFRLPVYIYVLGSRYRLEPNKEWQTFQARSSKEDQYRIDVDAGLFDLKEVR